MLQNRPPAGGVSVRTGYEPPDADPFGEHVINNSGKLRFCDRLLKRLISSQSRVLLFTQMKRMLDILEDYCRIRGFKYCRQVSPLGVSRMCERKMCAPPLNFSRRASLHSASADLTEPRREKTETNKFKPSTNPTATSAFSSSQRAPAAWG